MANFFQNIADFFKSSDTLLSEILKKIQNNIQNGVMDTFLEDLLKLMTLVFYLDRKFRKNIEGFHAKYSFQSQDGGISSSAVFENNIMKVERKALPNSNVTVTFKDGKALCEFLFSGNPDIFQFMLDNKLSYSGNPNYLFKFAYMANHLRLKFQIKLPYNS